MSDTLYIIRNIQGHYLGKHYADEARRWQDGSDNRLLWRTKYKDDASNTVFELSSKDVDLRAQIIPCDMDAKNEPVIKEIGPPVPQPEINESEAGNDLNLELTGD